MTTRIAALAAAVVKTSATVTLIANYALPEMPTTQLVLATTRG